MDYMSLIEYFENLNSCVYPGDNFIYTFLSLSIWLIMNLMITTFVNLKN